MDNAADENGPNQPVTGVEIAQQTSDNNNRQRVASGVHIVETAQHVIESDKKIDDDESLTPDNVTVTVTYILFLFSLFCRSLVLSPALVMFSFNLSGP